MSDNTSSPHPPDDHVPHPGQSASTPPQQPARNVNINQTYHHFFVNQPHFQAPPFQQNHQTFHHPAAGHPPHQVPPAGYAAQPPGAGYNPPSGAYYAPPPAVAGHPPHQVPPAGYATHPPGAGYNPPPGGYTAPPSAAAGHPPHQVPPTGYSAQPPGAGYNPPPGGHYTPPPAVHYINQHPPQNLQAQMMMNTVYNSGCTINNVGSIGSQTTYNIINSKVDHVGPQITKNIKIETLSVGMGVKPEELETFVKFLGEDKDNSEYLQNLKNLSEEHKFSLPSVSKMMRSTCLIQHLGPHGGKWHGTGFLSTLPDFEGAALLSAGHNFEDGGNLLKEFESFHLLFNNEHGLNFSNLNSVKNNSVIDFNLTTFMSKFSRTTLVLTYGGKQFVQHGNQPPSEKPHKNAKLDYFALLLHGPDAQKKIKDLNLDFIEAARMDELKKSGEPVFIFGHPGVNFCVCCKKAKGCSCKKKPCLCEKNCNCGSSTPPCPCRPVPCQHASCSCRHSLRFSYALSKKEEITARLTDRMKYLLDTIGGMSGSAITGAKYKVKGIHVAGGDDKDKYNYAQTLRAVIKDIQKLKILTKEAPEKCEGFLNKLKLEDSESSDDASDTFAPNRLSSGPFRISHHSPIQGLPTSPTYPSDPANPTGSTPPTSSLHPTGQFHPTDQFHPPGQFNSTGPTHPTGFVPQTVCATQDLYPAEHVHQQDATPQSVQQKAPPSMQQQNLQSVQHQNPQSVQQQNLQSVQQQNPQGVQQQNLQGAHDHQEIPSNSDPQREGEGGEDCKVQ